jgi:uncharacterized protein
MKRIFLTIALLCGLALCLTAQRKAYTDSLKRFRAAYIQGHEVVPQEHKKYFRFFPINPAYALACRFERTTDSVGIVMKTVAQKEKKYYRYGILHFVLNNQPQQLTVFQSPDLLNVPEYADYLFVPFTDATTGSTTYGSGRYLDLRLGDIKGQTAVLDFNKAYNPYCAYASGYNCPIPPAENRLRAAIPAGEKNWPLHR